MGKKKCFERMESMGKGGDKPDGGKPEGKPDMAAMKKRCESVENAEEKKKCFERMESMGKGGDKGDMEAMKKKCMEMEGEEKKMCMDKLSKGGDGKGDMEAMKKKCEEMEGDA